MATSAPMPFELFCNESDTQPTTVQLTPYTLRDVQQIDNFVRSRLYAAAMLSIAECDDPSLRAEVLDSAGRAAISISFYGANAMEYIASVEGYALLLLTSWQKLMPTTTLQQCADIIRDDRNMLPLRDALRWLRTGELPAKEAKTDQPDFTATDSLPNAVQQ